MNILGIRYGHDASATLIRKGIVIADVSEERFTRIKNDTSFPINAISYCLEEGKIDSTQIDILALPSLAVPQAFYAFFRFPDFFTMIQIRTDGKSNETICKTKKRAKSESSPFPEHIVPTLPLYYSPFQLSPSIRVFLIEHHICHAASACYTSGFKGEKALVATMDGCGDDVSSAIWRYDGSNIELIKKFDCTGSLGWFYANATEGVGWRHGSDEWKIMGLAPYGTPKPGILEGFYPKYENGYLVSPHHYGSFGRWNDHGANHYHGKDAYQLSKIFGKIGDENYAAEVQRVSEEQAANFILPWLEREKTRHLLCAGGFFLNVKFNQKLWYSGKLDSLWIYPNAGDSGLSMGASLFAHMRENPNKILPRLEHLYFGPEYSNEQIERILSDRSLSYRRVGNPSKITAQYLEKNYVVGWFQGRMEAGPRALGNRSILMSPLNARNKDIINAKIKYREHFRPFAPALPVEKMFDYLINPREEYFMTCAFDVVEHKRRSIPAVVHVDNTVRPQMVSRSINERYYEVIQEFGNLTGEYVVLNTSFNVKGEPIVNHPRDAIKCFFDTGMDILVLGDFVIEKPSLVTT